MIRQAGKRLGADDIFGSAVDQFNHLSGQEPALPGLVADGDKRFGIISQLADLSWRRKTLAGFQGVRRRFP